MTKHRKAQIITASLLLVVLGAVVVRKTGWRRSDPRPAQNTVQASSDDPQSAVYAMLDAARAGDVDRYITAYTGAMKAELKQVAAESDTSNFARYLRDSNTAIKGIAVSDPQITGSTASVRVEYVYQDRNETQTLHLEHGAAGWKIARADADERTTALIVYGTPIKSLSLSK